MNMKRATQKMGDEKIGHLPFNEPPTTTPFKCVVRQKELQVDFYVQNRL